MPKLPSKDSVEKLFRHAQKLSNSRDAAMFAAAYNDKGEKIEPTTTLVEKWRFGQQNLSHFKTCSGEVLAP